MPQLQLLKSPTSSERGLCIVHQIGSSYTSFGTNILHDDSGSRVKALEHQFQRDSSSINWEILRLWLNGKGRKPVTWATLVKVLREIEMNHLVHNIESYLGAVEESATPAEVKQSSNETATPGEVKPSSNETATPGEVAQSCKETKTSGEVKQSFMGRASYTNKIIVSLFSLCSLLVLLLAFLVGYILVR